MTRISKPIVLTFLVIFTLLIGVSCTPQKKPLPPNRVMPRENQDTRQIAPQTPVKSTADDVARQAAKIDGVDNAYVVITGNTALIGLDLKSDITGEKTKNIKNQVANIAKGSKGITNAQVTSNPDLVGRIKDVAGGISKGRPLSEFTDQVKEILNRIKAES